MKPLTNSKIELCVCKRERQRETETEKDRDRDRDTERNRQRETERGGRGKGEEGKERAGREAGPRRCHKMQALPSGNISFESLLCRFLYDFGSNL